MLRRDKFNTDLDRHCKNSPVNNIQKHMKYIYLKSYNSDNCLDMPDTSYLNLKDNMKPDKPYKSHYYYMFDNSINR